VGSTGSSPRCWVRRDPGRHDRHSASSSVYGASSLAGRRRANVVLPLPLTPTTAMRRVTTPRRGRTPRRRTLASLCPRPGCGTQPQTSAATASHDGRRERERRGGAP
jgi:hypothetical protein